MLQLSQTAIPSKTKYGNQSKTKNSSNAQELQTAEEKAQTEKLVLEI